MPVLTGPELNQKDARAMRLIQEGMQTKVGPLVQDCYDTWLSTNSGIDVPAFSIPMSVHSANGRARVDVGTVEWPSEVGEALRECVHAAFDGANFDMDVEVSLSFEYPICFRSAEAEIGRETEAAPECPTQDFSGRTAEFAVTFQKEPRNERWAAEREKLLGTYFAEAENRTGLEDVRIDCRCRCCRVVAACSTLEECNDWMMRVQRDEGVEDLTRPLFSSKRPAEVERGGYLHLFLCR